MADLMALGSSNESYSNSCVWSWNKASNSIYLSQCSPQEVYNEIAKLKTKKATRTFDIETKFIKFANPAISKFVSDIFNFCLKKGVYPDSLKVEEVIPIFKKVSKTKPQITVQYHFSPNWNDRRSRRVFLCFYSAIFQLTSATFQTFAYNSRTVGSSCMKFGQQFEINELYVCTKLWSNRSRDFGFRTRKPPRKFGVKSGLSQKRHKKIFHRVVCLKTPFHPNQPMFGRNEVYFVFFPFFFPKFCTLFFS